MACFLCSKKTFSYLFLLIFCQLCKIIAFYFRKKWELPTRPRGFAEYPPGRGRIPCKSSSCYSETLQTIQLPSELAFISEIYYCFYWILDLSPEYFHQNFVVSAQKFEILRIFMILLVCSLSECLLRRLNKKREHSQVRTQETMKQLRNN